MAALAILCRYVVEGCAAAIFTIKSLDPPALDCVGKMTFGDDRTKREELIHFVGGGGGGRGHGVANAAIFSKFLSVFR